MPTPELAPQTPTTDKTVQPTPLDELVAEVRSDATRDPKQYARDAIVPEGGE